MTARRTIALALALACLLLLAGCTLGYKKWPEPQERQDAFTWHAVTPQLAGSCLMVEGRLDGAFENFKSVRLLAEPLDEAACPECPFHPVLVRNFAPGDPDFELVGPWMKMRVCSVRTDIPYRLRLEAENKLDGMGNVTSKVVRVAP